MTKSIAFANNVQRTRGGDCGANAGDPGACGDTDNCTSCGGGTPN